MTEKEWDIAETTCLQFRWIYLDVDGYHLAIRPVRETPLKFVLMVWINGKISREDPEIMRRFFCRRWAYVHSAKTRAYFNRLSDRKRRRLAIKIGVNSKAYYDVPLWTSFRSLKRHLIKQNKSIKLITQNYKEYANATQKSEA